MGADNERMTASPPSTNGDEWLPMTPSLGSVDVCSPNSLKRKSFQSADTSDSDYPFVKRAYIGSDPSASLSLTDAVDANDLPSALSRDFDFFEELATPFESVQLIHESGFLQDIETLDDDDNFLSVFQPADELMHVNETVAMQSVTDTLFSGGESLVRSPIHVSPPLAADDNQNMEVLDFGVKDSRSHDHELQVSLPNLAANLY